MISEDRRGAFLGLGSWHRGGSLGGVASFVLSCFWCQRSGGSWDGSGLEEVGVWCLRCYHARCCHGATLPCYWYCCVYAARCCF